MPCHCPAHAGGVLAHRSAHHNAQAGLEEPVPQAVFSKQDRTGPFAEGLSSPWCATTTASNASRNKLIQGCVFSSQHILGVLITAQAPFAAIGL